ncbi:hypothetical protein B0H34DRAFT_654370 [Crassisporium funariophilum]|nr:hypothetical protein B0H34DRAFT_654370 [Crassisporium funariophilum]
MTSRLKRKLGDLGVDTSSRRATENFCLIGTPLPPLEKSRDTGEFVPLWKQEVRDEKGRRRLHGAFTGGFSAGYYNTVGSKEGWAPQTFVSSRSDRAKQKSVRPEDFMDEEDLQDLKDSRNLVDTTEEMDFLGGTQKELQGKNDVDEQDKDPITRTLEATLFPAPKDSAGARILMKMGWRLGQGIGPRLTLKERKAQDAEAYQATTGARYSGGTLNIPEDDEEATKHTYAPRDTPILHVKRKDNSHGVGYVPGLSLNESIGESSGGANQGPKLAGGFGLGALNDAEDDDLDVYDHSHQQSRRRLAYDNADGGDDDTVVIGSRSDKHKAPQIRSTSSMQIFRDGRPVPVGFVLADEPVAEDPWFELPDVPPGWSPNPKKVWAQDTNKENLESTSVPSQAEPHEKWRRSKISADQRGVILGEKSLPSAPRSVFDYMSEKDSERIKRITSKLAAGPTSEGSDAAPTPIPAPATISITKLEAHVAQAALRGFQPFTSDPAKQARYIAYLQSQASQDASAPSLKPKPGQKIDDFNKEVEDYAKAASLFKPISGAMAGRFTSAAVIDFGPKVHEGLHTPSVEEMEEKEAQRIKEEEEKISPKALAAKMGMYGPLTRETKPWQPGRLLCKRFGVKDPDPPPDNAGEGASAGPSRKRPSFAHPEQGGTIPTVSVEKDDTTPVQKSTGPRDLANIGLGEDETQGEDTLTYQRPPMDIFKAIFASDDEDSDDEEDTKADDDVPEETSPTNAASSEPMKAATVIPDDTPIDLSTFKPTFIPREGKAKKSRDDEKSKEKRDKKDKKDRKKKEKKGVLVSFEMEEYGMEPTSPKQAKDRPKKKKRKERKEGNDADDDVGMWADNPVPEVLDVGSDAYVSGSVDALPKGRKRAIDFM